ncbi:hypothetical protein J7K06_02385 [Candidatus Bathyarchaeota archaeon]|nr:hypothetical protein [Candidatus Bathyarchaeota archaeon]
MFGAIIFIIFFAIFTTASILLPVQFFPGSLLENLAIIPDEYEQYVSAITNGLIYSTIIWLISLAINKKIKEE